MAISATRFWQIIGVKHFKAAHTADGSLITYQQQKEVVSRTRKTETRAFADANGKRPLEPAPPLLDIPDLYRHGKKCNTCGKLRKPSEFSPQRMRGKVYLKAKCKYCRAEEAYTMRHNFPTMLR